MSNGVQLGLRVKQRSVLPFNTPSSGLSRAMSQMCVDTPGAMPGQILSQETGGTAPSSAAPPPAASGPSQPNLDGMMSQGMPIFTPDFITPADAQFACNYDPSEKENKGPRSPCHLSPMRSKRPRFGFDPNCLSQDSQLGSQPMGGESQPGATPGWGTQPGLSSQGTAGAAGGMGAECRGENSGGASEAIFRMPAPRAPVGGAKARGAPLPRAAQSPPCHRNAFLDDAEQPAECLAHGRAASSTSAAALATMSRLRTDFVDLGTIGRGGFCKVFKVIGRLDGALYAVKRTERKLQTEREKVEALREVQAMAGLGSGCEHIVRYFGAWMEYDHLYIQLELCDTTLAALQQQSIRSREAAADGASIPEAGDHAGGGGAAAGFVFGEKEVVEVLRHVGAALACAHARRVAHLDVKPDNILVLRGVYKLADWGRAAPVDGVGNVSFAGAGRSVGHGGGDGAARRAGVSVEEGDARYLAPELLRGDFQFHAGGGVSSSRGSGGGGAGGSSGGGGGGGMMDGSESPTDAGMQQEEEEGAEPLGASGADFVGLDGADIFSLGATAYELARGKHLPSGGDEYQLLRRGKLTLLPGFSVPFQSLLASMMREDPTARPTARGMLKSGALARPNPPAANGGGGGLGVGGGAGGGDGGGSLPPGVPVPQREMMMKGADGHRHHAGAGPSVLGQESRGASLGGIQGGGLHPQQQRRHNGMN